ncbi:MULTISPECIES: 7-cyano-7-deazaguanine synthase [Metallosphaera]|uniref:7-cyano-7-deazaguanine synthase n=3 Tax=Metallosphaera TaxID=41980 RepID=A4YH21_METS5|nr:MULTISPECIES: 7-cyano-7-deazaguanine synthase [Metallosphaera]ABP95723.1 ExsB family protein [Metallosphaera sedula DSM 5348]AIM27707.1 ExsB family protein [Metallosphaera sedula]AKV74562.1 7-cyano-7-deazaguanine synthase [Metallosphaera sedula]AKV76801.1 7-cyano-7-deazaguanine synthase [Metallosphaera sedula]AKV79052.1 7-cyano-7-deazaguanine synthase [Metallosphaera sedula]
MKSLFLVSGGLDSTAGMYRFREMDYDCMTIDYGQRAFKEQVKYARINCEKLGKRLIEVNMKKVGDRFREGKSLIPHEPIRHRNAVTIPFALTYASEMGYSAVYVFTVSEECQYESNKPEIISALRKLAEALRIGLIFPFLGLSKAHVLRMGIEHGMDPLNTYSCLLGHRAHCGRCSQCESRKMAFKIAGVDDKTKYLWQ